MEGKLPRGSAEIRKIPHSPGEKHHFHQWREIIREKKFRNRAFKSVPGAIPSDMEPQPSDGAQNHGLLDLDGTEGQIGANDSSWVDMGYSTRAFYNSVSTTLDITNNNKPLLQQQSIPQLELQQCADQVQWRYDQHGWDAHQKPISLLPSSSRTQGKEIDNAV